MSVREFSKQQRRDRIVAAARQLIGETGDTALSMRALAVRANVSLPTPYNLFGSKRAVLEAVLQADLTQFLVRVDTLAVEDALARIFGALRLAAEVYRKEPDFYTTLFKALIAGGGFDLLQTFDAPRKAFWRELVRQAVMEGALLPDTRPGLVARTLGHVFGGVLQEWIGGQLDLDGMEASLTLEIGLVLAGTATETGRLQIRGHVEAPEPGYLASKPEAAARAGHAAGEA